VSDPIQIDLETHRALPEKVLEGWLARHGVTGRHVYHVTVDPEAMTATVYRYWRASVGGVWLGAQRPDGTWAIARRAEREGLAVHRGDPLLGCVQSVPVTVVVRDLPACVLALPRRPRPDGAFPRPVTASDADLLASLEQLERDAAEDLRTTRESVA
jgi:hypothetical protein